MITHRHKQIKKQLVAHLHLQLHGPATLEDLPGPNNHRQVMSAQSILRVGRVVVGVPRRAEDHVHGDPTLQPLLAQRELLEIIESVPLRGAVYDRVAEDDRADGGVEDGCFAGSTAAGVVGVLCVLEFPAVGGGVAEETWEVVAFVEELEDAG